jgi:hypothetical protein
MDLSLTARLVTVAVAGGTRYIGFAEGDEDEPYALFAQSTRGGAITLEVNDPLFSAEDAVTRVTLAPMGLSIEVAPAAAPALGFARLVTIRLLPATEGWPEALPALRRMLGTRLVDSA